MSHTPMTPLAGKSHTNLPHLPMVIGLSYGSTTYFFPLTIRDQIPGSNKWQLAAENFEWHGTLPGHPLVILSFAQNSLTLTAQKVHIARFPYPSPNTRSNVDSLEPPGWTMFPAPGSYFFATASLSRGHVHPVKPLVIDPRDCPLPPLLIRWPQTSPGKASNLPLATPAEMFPVPSWLSQEAKALFEKGPAFLASSTCLVDENLVVRDWLPAYCAHTIPGFGEDHLLTIVAPEVISAFGSRVASPLLDGEQGVALDYLKSVLESAEEPWQVKTRRHRPPPLPVGAPDDQQILLFSSTQTSRLEKKVDELPLTTLPQTEPNSSKMILLSNASSSLTVSRCVISANPTLLSLPLSPGFASPSLMKGNKEVKQASPPWPPTYLALVSSSSLEIVNKLALALGGIPSRKLYSIAWPKNLLVFSAAQALACQLKCFTLLRQLCEQTLP